MKKARIILITLSSYSFYIKTEFLRSLLRIKGVQWERPLLTSVLIQMISHSKAQVCLGTKFATLYCLLSNNSEYLKFDISLKCIYFNPFHATDLFLYPLKTSEKKRFSDVFRVMRKNDDNVNIIVIFSLNSVSDKRT